MFCTTFRLHFESNTCKMYCVLKYKKHLYCFLFILYCPWVHDMKTSELCESPHTAFYQPNGTCKHAPGQTSQQLRLLTLCRGPLCTSNPPSPILRAWPPLSVGCSGSRWRPSGRLSVRPLSDLNHTKARWLSIWNVISTPGGDPLFWSGLFSKRTSSYPPGGVRWRM